MDYTTLNVALPPEFSLYGQWFPNPRAFFLFITNLTNQL